MKLRKYLLFILFPLVLQTVFFPHLPLFGVVPNLVLMITICYGLLEGARPGLYLGILGGLCLDLASSGILGINIIVLGALGFGVGYLERMVFKGYLLVPLCLVQIGTVLAELISYCILRAFGWRINFLSFLGSTLLPLCLYHLLLTVPIYYGLKKSLTYFGEQLKVGATP
ncbi:MAG TPA: rod shape-determining protein MreD [Firmicutes bacterium]|nr:rod shape-determining protein MreD [Bacillota bacterium]